MSPITLAILIAIILFAVARRARALIGRQKIWPTGLATRLATFTVLGVVIIAVTIAHPLNLLGDVVGLAIGAALAWYGLRLTVFEHTPDGSYYTPNLYIGLAVFVLFIARFGYRVFTVMQQSEALTKQAANGAANPFAQFSGGDPLTSAAYFILIGYYVVYYIALLVRHRQETATQGSPHWS